MKGKCLFYMQWCALLTTPSHKFQAVAELKNISHLTDTSFVQRARGKQNTSLVTVDDPGLGFFSVDVEWNYNAVSGTKRLASREIEKMH